MIKLLALTALLGQQTMQPGGIVGPGGPWVPQQSTDAGALTFSYGGNNPVPATGPDGGIPIPVCIQSDCGPVFNETRWLFAGSAHASDGGYTPVAPVSALNHISKGGHPHYVITDYTLENASPSTNGCAGIYESTQPGCDGGAIMTIVPMTCLLPLNHIAMDLVTPQPLDDNQYICCGAPLYTPDVQCKVNGYSTTFTPRVTN
jgi:hypothetical protein